MYVIDLYTTYIDMLLHFMWMEVCDWFVYHLYWFVLETHSFNWERIKSFPLNISRLQVQFFFGNHRFSSLLESIYKHGLVDSIHLCTSMVLWTKSICVRALTINSVFSQGTVWNPTWIPLILMLYLYLSPHTYRPVKGVS